jgi:hypothetical protein
MVTVLPSGRRQRLHTSHQAQRRGVVTIDNKLDALKSLVGDVCGGQAPYPQ